MSDIDDEGFTELIDADVPRVDLVDLAANGSRGFLVMKGAGLMTPMQVRDLLAKAEMTGADVNSLPDSAFAYIEPGGHVDDEGRTTPRSLRHFPVHDAAHVRNALARAPQSPLGDKAMPKIRAAARRFGIEVSKMIDGDDSGESIDVTEPLAEPAIDAPGQPGTPGSPAWEAIDAATACKWTSILARAKRAVELLADREMMEAAAGHGEDAGQAMDLCDAACAIDHAISVLAPFAVAEESEATAAVEMIGKALDGYDPAGLDLVEALGQVRKAGRVLSSANEAAIRGAVESLQKVLASLPAAPAIDDSGRQVAKREEAPVGIDSQLLQPPADPEPVTKADEADDQAPPKVVAVYDARGKLVGVVHEGAITAVEQPAGDDASDDAAPEPEPETPDLDPAPKGDVGIPADAVEDCVAKSTDQNTPDMGDLLKSVAADAARGALDAWNAQQGQVIAKQGETMAQMAELVKALEGRVGTLEEQPAAPKVFTRGATPPPEQLRGQDHGAPQVDLTKAAELRRTFYSGDPAAQNQAAEEMQHLAIQELTRLRG